MKQQYVRVQPSPDGRQLERKDETALRDLLYRSSQFDRIVVQQYLSCCSTMDWIAALSPGQQMVLTSLGHEIFEKQFDTFFEPASNIRIVEISRYAAERSRSRGILADHVSAGVCQVDIRSPRPVSHTGVQRLFRAIGIGRLLPHKGFEVTIRGLPETWELKIVGPPSGDGHYERYLNRAAKETGRVELLGYQDVDQLDDQLRQSKALIASSCHHLYHGKIISQAELFGLVILEAVAAGVLPIASDIPSFREVMTSLGLQQWLYPERDSTSLRNTLLELDDLPAGSYRGLVASAQTLLARNYLWDDYWQRVFARFEGAQQTIFPPLAA